MSPSQLSAGTFDRYPPRARAIATERLELLRSLPLLLLVSLLREISGFDWLFPAEQRSLSVQLDALAALTVTKRTEVFGEFARISVPEKLRATDWVNDPKQFLEQLTAWLWSSSQIDQFHKAARDFSAAVDRGVRPQPLLPRVSLVVLPVEVNKPGYAIFRKLRAHGTFYEDVSSAPQLTEIAEWMASRASMVPEPFAHFYIDGGVPADALKAHAETLSWTGTGGMREQILSRVAQMTKMPGTGPEMARTSLASLVPAELGLHAEGREGVAERFALSVLAEGAGTQLFSTTFAQWSAREVLRRAQPLTLAVRIGVRRRLQSMNEMLSGSPSPADPQGSFVDGDIAAYYTWINQQRLAGSDQAGFLALAQSSRQAVTIGPTIAKGAVAREPVDLGRLLGSLTA